MTRAGSARPGRGRVGRLWWVALAALCGACGIVESYRIAADAPLPASGTPCASTLGSYSLPKAHVQVVVRQAPGGAPTLAAFSAEEVVPPSLVKVVRHPDPALNFCLDHISSAFAHDEIKIEKWPYDATATTADKVDQASKTPFLGAVSINALDQTSYIVRALLRSFFILATGDVDFTPRGVKTPDTSVIVADLEYDPFNQFESAAANRRLSELGYCAVLESFTYDTQRFSVDQYCSAPDQYGRMLGPISAAYLKAEAIPADPRTRGLLYRPRHPYRLAIYRKQDARGRDRWLLSHTTYVELENLSPVLSLAIERAAFAERTANFVFDAGTLVTACVSKTSELQGFVEIPLEIAKSIVEVPGAIFKVRINQFAAQKSLIDAQRQLYDIQNAYLQALASGTFTPTTIASKKFVSYGESPLKKIGEVPALPKREKRKDADAYGTDLFGVNLATLCRGKT